MTRVYGQSKFDDKQSKMLQLPWERNWKRKSRFYWNIYSCRIDLHQTITKMILGLFYTYRQYISQAETHNLW